MSFDTVGINSADTNSGTPMDNENTHIIRMMNLALRTVLLKRRGWQIAYHRSTDMALRVSTDTETDTFCKIKIHFQRSSCLNKRSKYSCVNDPITLSSSRANQ